MLAAASAKLAAIGGALDAAKVNAATGMMSGTSLSASSFGLNIAGAGAPGVVTTQKGGTNTMAVVDSTTGVTTGGTSSSPTTTRVEGTTTTTGQPTTDVQTTRSAFNPPTASAPASTIALPTSIGMSASDLLNEQVQLMNEIANLRLLLDGAVSDQFIDIPDKKKQRMVKRRLTIGIPITIAPTKNSKNKVTFVEVVAWSPNLYDKNDRLVYSRLADIPPAIVSLLPKDKTYNTATITDKNLNFAGGAVLGVLGAGAAYTRSRRTWYAVAAQDTVALTLPAGEGDDPSVRFAWQLRPVLRQSYLRAGTRELMVQLAPPTEWAYPIPITLKVRTYLREYDQKTGLVGKIIEPSVSNWAEHDIRAINLAQYPKSVESIEDLGNGNVLVNLQGRFLNGTYVRVGGRRIAEGNGLSFEADRIRFEASRLELAARDVRIVSRDGTETEIELDKCSPLVPEEPELVELSDNEVRMNMRFQDPHEASSLTVYTLLV
ncbi:MAG: hypothetical protein B7X34_03650, partial [Acidobacteriia bacterium 12-62-4]